MWYDSIRADADLSLKFKNKKIIAAEDDPVRDGYPIVLQAYTYTRAFWGITKDNISKARQILSVGDPVQQKIICIAFANLILAGYTPTSSVTLTLYKLVLIKKMPLSADELVRVLASVHVLLKYGHKSSGIISATSTQVNRFLKSHEATALMKTAVIELASSSLTSPVQRKSLLYSIPELNCIKPVPPIRKSKTPWNKEVRSYLSSLDEQTRNAWAFILDFAASPPQSKLNKKWLTQGYDYLDQLGDVEFLKMIKHWMEYFKLGLHVNLGWLDRLKIDYSELGTHRGLIYLCSKYEDSELAGMLGDLGFFGYSYDHIRKTANAAIITLAIMPGPHGIAQLAILKSRLRNKSALKLIERLMRDAAKNAGLTQHQLEDRIVQDYSLQPGGAGEFSFGDFTLRSEIESTTKVAQVWLNAAGKQQKSVPQAVKDHHTDELKQARANLKEMQKTLRAQRDRIDLFLRQKISWPYPDWKQYYLEHGLTSWLTRRLIWHFIDDDHDELAAWDDGRMVNLEGRPVDWPAEGTTVQLYHPIDHDQDTVIAWRDWIFEREIRQPFKQAFREVYILTDAEVNTHTYSNRFAAHILNAGQFVGLGKTRLWNMPPFGAWDGGEEARPILKLPDWKLNAEFWVEVIGDDISEQGFYRHVATDQVRFSDENGDTIPLGQIPARVFSEVMRDVDMFVGVASIGNDPEWADAGGERDHSRYWRDYAFGDLKESAQSRRQVLERLVPRLKIAARATLDGKFLVVRGDIRTYKIHLGSGNIMMEPGNRYLCIVPARGSAAERVYLPFEGDRLLSIILSKSFLLAEDTKIKDPTIVSQIKR